MFKSSILIQKTVLNEFYKIRVKNRPQNFLRFGMLQVTQKCACYMPAMKKSYKNQFFNFKSSVLTTNVVLAKFA